MNDDKITVTVTDRRSGQSREMLLERSAWPLTIGRNRSCSVVLDDDAIAEQQARVERQGIHNILVRLAEGPLTFRGTEVGDTPQRIDRLPLEVGPFTLSIRF